MIIIVLSVILVNGQHVLRLLQHLAPDQNFVRDAVVLFVGALHVIGLRYAGLPHGSNLGVAQNA